MPRKKPVPAVPVGVAAVLAPFADLAYPLLPEPVITDEERDAMIAALGPLARGDEDAVVVPLPDACADVGALALALRVTAGRMGLPFGFYARPTPVPALIARRLR